MEQQRTRSNGSGRDTRERILRAASSLFAARGFSATPVRAIADESGISNPAIYHYFRSKRAILDALLIDPPVPEVAPPPCWGPAERQAAIRQIADALINVNAYEENLRLAILEALRNTGEARGFTSALYESYLRVVGPLLEPACSDDKELVLLALSVSLSGLVWDAVIQNPGGLGQLVNTPAFRRRLESLIDMAIPLAPPVERQESDSARAS